MTQYQSELKTISSSREVVFGLLSDFENLRPLIENSGKEMQDLHIEQERISFNIPAVGNAGFQLSRKEPYQYIEFKSFDIPVNITAGIRLQEQAECETLMQLFLEGDFPPVIAMMLGPKIKSGIGKMADAIANAINQNSSNK
jgi:hypothetical protein